MGGVLEAIPHPNTPPPIPQYGGKMSYSIILFTNFIFIYFFKLLKRLKYLIIFRNYKIF